MGYIWTTSRLFLLTVQLLLRAIQGKRDFRQMRQFIYFSPRRPDFLTLSKLASKKKRQTSYELAISRCEHLHARCAQEATRDRKSPVRSRFEALDPEKATFVR